MMFFKSVLNDYFKLPSRFDLNALALDEYADPNINKHINISFVCNK